MPNQNICNSISGNNQFTRYPETQLLHSQFCFWHFPKIDWYVETQGMFYKHFMAFIAHYCSRFTSLSSCSCKPNAVTTFILILSKDSCKILYWSELEQLQVVFILFWGFSWVLFRLVGWLVGFWFLLLLVGVFGVILF